MANYYLADFVENDKIFIGNLVSGDVITNTKNDTITIARLTYDTNEKKLVFTDELTIEPDSNVSISTNGSYYVIEGANSITSTTPKSTLVAV